MLRLQIHAAGDPIKELGLVEYLLKAGSILKKMELFFDNSAALEEVSEQDAY